MKAREDALTSAQDLSAAKSETAFETKIHSTPGIPIIEKLGIYS